MAKLKDKRKSPESLDRVNEVNPKLDIKDEFVGETLVRVGKDFRDRETRDNKMIRYYKKRYGVRPTDKSFPWPGASNVNIFLSDEKIRKLKPNFLNLAFEGDPVVNFEALGKTPLQTAKSAELLMDWLLRFKMNQAPGLNYFKSLAIGVDRMLEQGKSFLKIVWSYTDANVTRVIDLTTLPKNIQEIIFNPLITDEELSLIIVQFTELDQDIDEDAKQIDKMIKEFRSGKAILKFKTRIETYNAPRVIPVADKDLIVPTFITDLQTSPRITNRLFFTSNQLRMDQRSGKYDNVDKILENRKVVPQTAIAGRQTNNTSAIETLNIVKRTREGISQFEKDNELIEIWEIYTWFDIDNDGVDERVVITIDPLSETILRFIEFPYEHGKWPFIDFNAELNDDRFYSQRGIPELLDHYQTILTNQENAKLDRMTLANSLQFKYRIGGANPKNIRFIPGQGIPLHRMEDLQELKVSNLDISFDAEMDKMRKLAEAYIGQPDLDLGNLSAGKERRTAFEVSEMVSLGKQIFSFDARLFKDSLAKMYDQIFELWIQYGPDEAEIRITGGEPIVLRKSDVVGNFVIVPSGDFSMLSRTIQIQKAFAELQLAVNDQSGAIDVYNAWENYLLKADPKSAGRILATREQFDQIQAQKFEAAQQAIEDKKEIAGRGSKVKLGESSTGAVTSGNSATKGGGNKVG